MSLILGIKVDFSSLTSFLILIGLFASCIGFLQCLSVIFGECMKIVNRSEYNDCKLMSVMRKSNCNDLGIESATRRQGVRILAARRHDIQDTSRPEWPQNSSTTVTVDSVSLLILLEQEIEAADPPPSYEDIFMEKIDENPPPSFDSLS